MRRRGEQRWAVRFADVEPDLRHFFDRFVSGLERDPATGRFGRWLNPSGRWDWWDLGGRFDGRILGQRRRQGRTSSAVSSGPTAGRAILGNLHEALAWLGLPAETDWSPVIAAAYSQFPDHWAACVAYHHRRRIAVCRSRAAAG